VVQRFGWLDERQFLDAVAVAMITPGPVVITVGFIGYLVGGGAGAVVAALATFLPCYLFTVVPAPHFRRLSRNAALKAFVDGVTAAATGAIAGAAFVLGRRALVDVTAVAIALAAFVILAKVRRIPEPALIAAAGILGIFLKGAPEMKVVFVCEHGSAKSLVAASLFDRMAQERGIPARAVSRGLTPDAVVPDLVVQALGRDGFDVASFRPRALTAADVADATRVVAIGADPGSLAAAAGPRAVRWDGVPPVSTSYTDARRDLVDRIDRLLAELGPPR
jgi:chromate transport protein ChrA